MVLLFYTTYISVDLAHHEIFRAKFDKGGIKQVNRQIGVRGFTNVKQVRTIRK